MSGSAYGGATSNINILKQLKTILQTKSDFANTERRFITDVDDEISVQPIKQQNTQNNVGGGNTCMVSSVSSLPMPSRQKYDRHHAQFQYLQESLNLLAQPIEHMCSEAYSDDPPISDCAKSKPTMVNSTMLAKDVRREAAKLVKLVDRPDKKLIRKSSWSNCLSAYGLHVLKELINHKGSKQMSLDDELHTKEVVAHVYSLHKTYNDICGSTDGLDELTNEFTDSLDETLEKVVR